MIVNDPDPSQAELLRERAIAEAKSNKFETAISLIEDAIRLDPARSLSEYDALRASLYEVIGDDRIVRAVHVYNRAVSVKSEVDYAQSIKLYQEAMDLDPAFLWAYNNLSWLLATATDPSFHDGPKSIEYALKACELSNWSGWPFLGTLAAAYARAGDFRKAIETSEASLRLVPNDHMRYARSMLRGFRKGEAYIDEGDPPASGSDPSNKHQHPMLLGTNGNGSKRHLSDEGFAAARWGMSQAEVRAVYTSATEDMDGDLLLVQEFAGEESANIFIFMRDILWRVLVIQNYGIDGDTAVARFVALYEILSNEYGESYEERSDWHDQSTLRRDDPSIWGLAVAAGHLRMFTSWKTEETGIFLTCLRQEDGEVSTSIEFRSIHYWQEASDGADKAE